MDVECAGCSGSVDLVKAIAQSCDVYFYTVGGGYGDQRGLGPDNIKKYATLFGLGAVTGIDIPGEKSGLIPDAAWKKAARKEPWYTGDTYHESIGQGDVLSTPLQIANYTAAVANGGTLYKPQLVNRIVDSGGQTVKSFDKTVLRSSFISPENMAWVQKGMRENVVSGSGRALSTLKVEAAGKTGTAQYAGNTKTHAWYTVYAPYSNPEIVMAIMLEGGGEGHDASVPIAKDILKWYFEDRTAGAQQAPPSIRPASEALD
jgi:penicillin-binding protein 2